LFVPFFDCGDLQGAARLQSVSVSSYSFCMLLHYICRWTGVGRDPAASTAAAALSGDRHAYESEAVWLAFAMLSGALYMLFYLLAWKKTGPLVVMVFMMLFGDILKFLLLFGVFMLAFSQAFFILFNSNGFDGFGSHLTASIMGALGDFDQDAYMATPDPALSFSLLIVYVVMVPIMLMNLLIGKVTRGAMLPSRRWAD
jgi:hypothetical protein